jgi:hypothetical protein
MLDSFIGQNDQTKKMMVDRFDKIISSTGYGFGKLVNFEGVRVEMVRGMLEKEKDITHIFEKICRPTENPWDAHKTGNITTELKKKLKNELDQKSIDKKLFLCAFGKIMTGKLLQTIYDNEKKIPGIIIAEMVEKKGDDSSTSHNDPSQNGGFIKRLTPFILTPIVNMIFTKCIDDAEGWKGCFGEIAKLYDPSKETVLQETSKLS